MVSGGQRSEIRSQSLGIARQKKSNLDGVA